MSTKKVIYLPSRTALPPGARLLTEEEAEDMSKDRTKTWREFIPLPTTKEGSDGIIMITRFGSTEFWESHNMSFGLDFAPDEGKPSKIKRTDEETWQYLIASISKHYKKEGE